MSLYKCRNCWYSEGIGGDKVLCKLPGNKEVSNERSDDGLPIMFSYHQCDEWANKPKDQVVKASHDKVAGMFYSADVYERWGSMSVTLKHGDASSQIVVCEDYIIIVFGVSEGDLFRIAMKCQRPSIFKPIDLMMYNKLRDDVLAKARKFDKDHRDKIKAQQDKKEEAAMRQLETKLKELTGESRK